MDIKKASVNLLLDKIAELLATLPDDMKQTEKFTEAEKSLLKLKELFAGYNESNIVSFLACSQSKKPIYGD